MAGDQFYNSPVPPNWQELRKVTVIHHEHQSVSFAIVEKTGRLYHHLRYIHPDRGLEPNAWVSQVSIDKVTLIDGHDQRLRNRAMKWKAAVQDHQNKLREAFWEIDRQVSEEKRRQQGELEAQWRAENPAPPTPRFFTRRR